MGMPISHGSGSGAPPHGGPAPIPYAGESIAQRRLLDLTLHRAATPLVPVVPTISIDGRTYVVGWGRVTFEVPADRPVWVGVSLVSRGQGFGHASFLLAPHMPPQLEYRAPAHQGFAQGEIGPPGTVKHRGGLFIGCLLAALVALLLLLLVLVVALVAR